MMSHPSTYQLDQEFDALLEQVEGAGGNSSRILSRFLRYYKCFNTLFERSSQEDRQLLYDHLLLHHAKLGKSIDHIAETFGVKRDEVHSIIDEDSALTPADLVLRQQLHAELNVLGTELRRFKHSAAPRKKKPSSYRRKV